MIVFETSIVVLTITPNARAPRDPATGQPVTNCKDRIDHFIEKLRNNGERILIPTPVLAEFLVKAGPNKMEYLDLFMKQGAFAIGAFDTLAAVELAELLDADLQSGKPLDPGTTRAKLRFDRQITAIGKVNGATRICTDDVQLGEFADKHGMKPVYVWNLDERPPPPPKPEERTGDGKQADLGLADPNQS